MKTLFSIIIALLVATNVFAQKVIRESIEYSGSKIEMEFNFANLITIETWGKSIVELEVIVSINDNRSNEYYNLDISKRGASLNLTEKINFKRKNENINSDIVYKLKVPENSEISLNTISGKIEMFGLFSKSDISSISGFIDYSIPKTQKARFSVSTISGSVFQNIDFESYDMDASPVGTKGYLTMNGGNNKISLKTISGDIYLRELTR